MNAIRSAMSVFLLAVLTAIILGWRWSVALPSAKMESARMVLGLAALAAIIALGVIWSAKPQKSL